MKIIDKKNKTRHIYRGEGTILTEANFIVCGFEYEENEILLYSGITNFINKIIADAEDYAQNELCDAAKKLLFEEKNKFRFCAITYIIQIDGENQDKGNTCITVNASVVRRGIKLNSKSSKFIFESESGLIIPQKHKKLK